MCETSSVKSFNFSKTLKKNKLEPLCDVITKREIKSKSDKENQIVNTGKVTPRYGGIQEGGREQEIEQEGGREQEIEQWVGHMLEILISKVK